MKFEFEITDTRNGVMYNIKKADAPYWDFGGHAPTIVHAFARMQSWTANKLHRESKEGQEQTE